MYEYYKYRIREIKLHNGKVNHIAERRVFLFFWSKWFINANTKARVAMYGTNKETVKNWIENTINKKHVKIKEYN